MHESYIGGTQSHFDRKNRRKTSLKMRRNYLRRRSGLPKMTERMKYDDFPCYNSTHDRFHDRNNSSDDDGDDEDNDDDAEQLQQQKILLGLYRGRETSAMFALRRHRVREKVGNVADVFVMQNHHSSTDNCTTETLNKSYPRNRGREKLGGLRESCVFE